VSDIVALVPYVGRLPEGFKRIEQLFDPSVGGVNVICGDVLPDMVQI
jgi:hypothetical protein